MALHPVPPLSTRSEFQLGEAFKIVRLFFLFFIFCIATQWRTATAAKVSEQRSRRRGRSSPLHLPEHPGLERFPWLCSPSGRMLQPPAHRLDSLRRSRPLHVFFTLEMPSKAPDSVTLEMGNKPTECQDGNISLAVVDSVQTSLVCNFWSL